MKIRENFPESRSAFSVFRESLDEFGCDGRGDERFALSSCWLGGKEDS
jgi:hypothetical protein